MAYSFDMLGRSFTAAHFRHEVETFFRARPTAGPAGASPTTTSSATSRAGRTPGTSEALAKLAIALLASLPGTICLYQGEELGQTETELTYEELTDPPGLRFWPENKGATAAARRWSGRRTRPMRGSRPEALAAGEAAAGRPGGRPAGRRPGLGPRRLPPHARLPAGAGRAAHGRARLPRPARAASGPLARRRGATLCLFNLGPEERTVDLPGTLPRPVPRGAAGRRARDARPVRLLLVRPLAGQAEGERSPGNTFPSAMLQRLRRRLA
jgi:alpha-glucosidase